MRGEEPSDLHTCAAVYAPPTHPCNKQIHVKVNVLPMTEPQDTDVLDPSAVFPVLADSNPAWLSQFPACKLTLGP